ncbi:structural protein [Synechococcus phage Syn5]|uniref:Structural protein n=1 Tax=Synechococcus phage Syn5 TaxID=2914003 RepID=A4ZRD4_9CAUD|nr:structural protein [Synechococcus phage Syn5]ABP87960.1 structural protein [Synechococcus phage Syn5]
MALIVDPDDLTKDTEVVFDTAAKTIALVQTGNLSTDGVTLKCLYSFTKEQWKEEASLIRHPFPFTPITDESFELKDGWDFANDASRYLIRTGGWAVVDTSGVTQEMWAGIISLGSLESGTQPYFAQSAGTATDFQLTGPVNQAIKIFTNGGTDDRSTLTVFAREQGDKFAQSSLADIGVTGDMTFQAYRFPLSTSSDLKVTLDDSQVQTGTPATITITYSASPFARTIGGVSYNFDVEIDGQGQSLEDIYSVLQYRLRLGSDIDAGAGTQIGNVSSELASFLGDTLKLKEGVFLTNFNATDTNRILHDPLGGPFDIAFPFTASLTINFNANLVNDTSAVYRVFYTNDDAGDNTGRDFGTANAITVEDDTPQAMSDTVGGASSVTLTFDYDNNVQRGAASAGTDAPITVVAIGLATGQYVSATGTIARSTSNVVSLVSPLERNYSNP